MKFYPTMQNDFYNKITDCYGSCRKNETLGNHQKFRTKRKQKVIGLSRKKL